MKRRNILYSLMLVCFSAHISPGQEAGKWIKVTGDVGLFADFYSMQSDTPGAVAPRRPASLGRLVVNASFDVKDFSMPVTLALPTAQYGVMLPQIPKIPNAPFDNFKQLIKNPLNRVGIAPKYKWCQVMLGSQVPHYSELSVGDLAVFGAGLNLTPGKFRFSVFAGTSQLAIEEDTVKKIQGIYARKIFSAKIGVGHEDSSHVYLIASKMQDDTLSLQRKPTALMPQAGLLTSLDFRINFGKRIYFKGEIAGSAYTRNIHSKELPAFSPSLPKELFVPKESSRLDYATVGSLGGDWKNFGIKTTGRYYGDGFVPLGYPFMQTDRLEVTIDPRVTLFKGRFMLSGSVGQRINNLLGIRAATTTQTLGAANISMQITQQLSLSGSYMNFGFRNSVMNDTFRMEMVTVAWSVSPTYMFSGKNTMHSISVLFSKNTFTDFNVISGAVNNNNAVNGVVSYSVSGVQSPYSISTLLSYFDNITSVGRLTTTSVNAGAGYRFFKKKLNTTLGFTLADNKINNSSSGYQVMGIAGAKYTLKKKIAFALQGSVNVYRFGDSRPGISYRESLLRTSITYKL